jgi:hypothetical protein
LGLYFKKKITISKNKYFAFSSHTQVFFENTQF